MRLPMVDIHTVGRAAARSPGSTRTAGQGRTEKRRRRSGAGLLRPGRHQPTVTDANLMLGRLRRAGLIGGAWGSMRALAKAHSRRLPNASVFTPEKTALGVLDIVTANMVRAIRTVSVETRP